MRHDFKRRSSKFFQNALLQCYTYTIMIFPTNTISVSTMPDSKVLVDYDCSVVKKRLMHSLSLVQAAYSMVATLGFSAHLLLEY